MTYMKETILILERIIIHVVVKNSISNAKFKLCKELRVFHDVQAIENIKADAIWAQFLGEEQGIFH